MSENTPQRPDGLNDAAGAQQPRVQVEPTPAQPAPAQNLGYTAPGRTYVNQAPAGQAYAGQTSAGPVPPTGAAVPGAPAATETRTVVKTRTKKVPVFLSSLAGLAVGAVLVIALVMTGALDIDRGGSVTAANPDSTSQTIDIDPEDTTLSEVVAQKALPSVVSISTEIDTTSSLAGDSGASSGNIGSGVILDTDGNILTNYHVIQNASAIAVTLDDGTSYEAELVGTDESSDLAVIRLVNADSSALTPIEVGDSDNLSVGEWVMAIGSPFGNEQSVSTGIVSALYRSTALQSTSGTSIYANMIQTDAAINPGNSGGALVNDQGQLIGINSVIESYSGSSSGVGFAIPVNYAKNIADQIIAGKTPVHPYLGLTLTSVNALNARQNNLAVDSGAYVNEVTAGGPSEQAGIQQGDIITALDGEQITSADGLIIAVREHEVGDEVTLTVVRDGSEQEIKVTLGSDEALQAEQQDATQGDSSGSGLSEEDFMRYLQELMGQGGSGA